MPKLTQRLSLAVGTVVTVAGVLSLLTPGNLSATVLVAGGALFVVAGLRRSFSIGSFSIRWWQLDGAGLVAIYGFALAKVLELGTMETPLWTVITVIGLAAGAVSLLGAALDLFAGGKYIFPDLQADT